MFTVVVCLVLAPFFASWACCEFVMRVAPHLGLVDKPGLRKIHTKPTPTGGGLGIWIGVIVPAVALTILSFGINGEDASNASSLDDLTVWGVSLTSFPSVFSTHAIWLASNLPRIWIVLALGSLLVVLGTLDDRFDLPWGLRLGIEFVVASVAVACGWRLHCEYINPIFAQILSVFWIVGLVNSFNMLDNMDALSSGVATISSLFLGALAFIYAPETGGEAMLFLAASMLLLASSILGFLMLGKPPAKMFMGDGGAYFIGFVIATSTLSITFADAHAPCASVFVPLLIVAVPLYDTISVVTIRLKNKQSPFKGDTNHFGHRLVALGLSREQTILTIYFVAAICATTSFFVYRARTIEAIVMTLQTAFFLISIAIVEFAVRKKIRENNLRIEQVQKKIETMKESNDKA